MSGKNAVPEGGVAPELGPLEDAMGQLRGRVEAYLGALPEAERAGALREIMQQVKGLMDQVPNMDASLSEILTGQWRVVSVDSTQGERERWETARVAFESALRERLILDRTLRGVIQRAGGLVLVPFSFEGSLTLPQALSARGDTNVYNPLRGNPLMDRTLPQGWCAVVAEPVQEVGGSTIQDPRALLAGMEALFNTKKGGGFRATTLEEAFVAWELARDGRSSRSMSSGPTAWTTTVAQGQRVGIAAPSFTGSGPRLSFQAESNPFRQGEGFVVAWWHPLSPRGE